MITKDLKKARHTLLHDEIIGIPTETVYGLAGNAYSEVAIKKIFSLKRRPFYNPLIVHIKSAEYMEDIASEVPEIAKHLAEIFWPGPLTMVLKKQKNIPDLITAGYDTVAIRVPNHPLTLKLLNQLDFPLAAPSANPFGSISPTSAQHVLDYFHDKLEIILDGGKCIKGLESTIISFENNQAVLNRLGSISIEEIEKVIGKLKINNNNDQNPTAPGMLSRHYAPKTKMLLTNNVSDLIRSFENQKIGLLVFKNTPVLEKIENKIVLSHKGDLEEASSNLYAALHQLDKLNLDLIISERFPDHGLGKTINDRLQRAAKS